MVTRIKKTIAATTAAPEYRFGSRSFDSPEDMLHAMNKAANAGELFDPNISWQRKATALVSLIAMSFGVAWLGGVMIEFITLGVLTLTGSATAALIIWVLGLIVAVAASVELSSAIYSAVMSGRADKIIGKAIDWVRGTSNATTSWVGNKFNKTQDVAPAMH